MRRLRDYSAFTLIELLVVILILGILVAVAAPSFLGQKTKAHDASAKQSLAVAYRAAKASAVDRDGKYVEGPFDAAALALALKASEPQLDFIAGDCPTAVTTNPNFIVIDSLVTSDNDLQLCNDPELRVWTLTSLNYGSPAFTLNELEGEGAGDPEVAVAIVALPAISGTAATGQMLTASSGDWNGAPTILAYQWQVFDGVIWSNVGTGDTFTPTAPEDNKPLHVIVTASRAGAPGPGTSASATSAQTLPVVEHVENLTLPVISNLSPASNVELSVTNGSWQGEPTGYTYHWQAFAAGTWTEVGTAQTFTPSAAEAGQKLRVQIFAARPGSSNVALSAETALVVGPVVNSTPPVISGTPATGVQLSATNGSWTGSPTSFTYHWASSADGTTWSDVGIGLATFSPQASEAGKQIRVQVYGVRDGSSNYAYSTATGPVVAPVTNTVLPVLSGTAQQGSQLSVSNGSWSGAPTSYAYQWQRSNGAGWTDVGSGLASFTLSSAEVGQTVQVIVTASRSGSGSSATSGASATVLPAAPASSGAPVVSGSPRQGVVLTVSNGTWSGSPSGYAYQWQVSSNGGSSWASAAGAGNATSSYTVPAGDVGNVLRARVTATNAGGTTAAFSLQSITVTTGSIIATGGTVTDVGIYRIHTFTSGGTFAVSATNGSKVDALVVAGGGGGGGVVAGGGGGGGLLYSAALAVGIQSYPITVGVGGIGGTGWFSGAGQGGSSGSNSVFSSLTAIGGGGGGALTDRAALSGGSGGGAGLAGSGIGGTGTAGQGNGGGSDGGNGNYLAGGGGGAGAAGAAATSSVAGRGGDGLAYAISGGSVAYAGGGGGGCRSSNCAAGGIGGAGGGGSGTTTQTVAASGGANTGGGGGGAGYIVDVSNSTRFGGNGGSGIVIIRYVR